MNYLLPIHNMLEFIYIYIFIYTYIICCVIGSMAALCQYWITKTNSVHGSKWNSSEFESVIMCRWIDRYMYIVLKLIKTKESFKLLNIRSFIQTLIIKIKKIKGKRKRKKLSLQLKGSTQHCAHRQKLEFFTHVNKITCFVNLKFDTFFHNWYSQQDMVC